ncbi:MAG: hypothetical protein JW712_13215 [Dehalococcoidales bacterium]|nr:hypothetical protein [Dehalococcoidales bacterium]
MAQEQTYQYTEEEKRIVDNIEKKYGKSVQELYADRERRIKDAIEHRESDKVPVSLRYVYFPANYLGLKTSTAYYDPITWKKASLQTVLDFDPDMYMDSSGMSSGKVMDILQPTQTEWPGGPLPDNVSHQAIDIECMKADEYDMFLSDPTDFTIRYILPRAYTSLAPFGELPRLSGGALGFSMLTTLFIRPEFRELATKLVQAGEAQEQFMKDGRSIDPQAAKFGYPPHSHGGGVGGAPFDMISDFYRGMKGAMMDMFRCPDKLLAACDMLQQWNMQRAVPADPNSRGDTKRLFIALHRGAEGFMSNRQFEKFYWPGLKAALLKDIELGYVPMPFCEGAYGDRLEYFLELPKGKAVAHFDLTDMFRAKDILKGHVCIMGNVPSSLLQVGTPEDVDEYCKKLIQYCGKGGGLILTNGSSIDTAKPENIKAMIDSTRKYTP